MQIRHRMMTAGVPPCSDLCIVLPKRQQHCGTLLGWQATPLAALSCPSNWLRSSLQLSLHAGANVSHLNRPSCSKLQISKMHHTQVTVPALPGTSRDNHGTSLWLLGNLHQQTPPKGCSWQPRVQQSQTRCSPCPGTALSLSASLPHAKIILQNTAR